MKENLFNYEFKEEMISDLRRKISILIGAHKLKHHKEILALKNSKENAVDTTQSYANIAKFEDDVLDSLKYFDDLLNGSYL